MPELPRELLKEVETLKKLLEAYKKIKLPPPPSVPLKSKEKKPLRGTSK